LSSATPSRPESRLEQVAALYDRGLFLQAYAASADYWTTSTRLEDLSVDELILGMRLASRLGGSRLSRWLGREAMKRDPSHPKVRYFTHHLHDQSQRYFEHFREIAARPELEGADPETAASWLGYSAVQWAWIRDFDAAHKCLARARQWNARDPWVLSCESDVLACEDRWEEALEAAERAWELNPGAPYAARSLGAGLLNLRRVEEAARRLAKAAGEGESYEIALTACWYLGAWAETCMGDERRRVVEEMQQLAGRASALAPLADRETQAAIARIRLDNAELADDHAAMEHWAKEVRSPFHRKVLENLRKNPQGARIRLPFRHAIQKHNECLPTSIGSAMAAMGTPIDADAMAAELTFGGTPEWASAEWLEKQGYVVRFFVATPAVATALIREGFAFILTLEGDTSAHAVAVVGLDEAAGTVLVHDPGSFRSTEYLLEFLGKDEAPLGPKAMVAVLPERAQALDRLLPQNDSETMAAREAHRRAEYLLGPAAARKEAADLALKHPLHPNTRLLQALEDHHDGRIGAALEQFRKLLEEFPGSAFVRSNLLYCCRSLRNTSLMRKTLADVVERGILPGIESQQQWRRPPADYVSEYADLLRLSGATSGRAKTMFLSLLSRASYCASAWHNFGDLLWHERDSESALLCYRVASCLADRNEHYALAYSDVLGRLGRQEEGFAWLRARARKFANALEGVATWGTLISALEQAGYPERALAAAEEALGRHGNSAELLRVLVPFQSRMGNWIEAEDLLHRLEATGNTVQFHQASVYFHGIRGELDQALEHARLWLADLPLSMAAREEIVDLTARRSGPKAAIAQAREWLAERPGHEELEELYCRQLNRTGYTSWRKYSVLLRRVKRNREDSWAWLELAFNAIYDFDLANEKLQGRLETRIARYLAECDRTSPGEPATIRAHANWREARGKWPEAVVEWQRSVEIDPANMYAYRHLWDCAARLESEERLEVWKRIEAALLREPGHSSIARDIIMLATRRFGVNAAEAAVARWIKLRPEDPEIVEAYVDLLLKHGHGRTDSERALELLLPELQRFPYHLGLRLSHADALQKLGRFDESEEVFREIVRRHPDNSWSRIQLAWMKQRRGETEAALRDIEEAAARDPQNSGIDRAKAQVLIEEQRFAEARAVIAGASQRFPADVGWRDDAIGLLVDCGDLEQAIAVARGGVQEYPYGAYLWLLLGRTLAEHRQFAAQGEIESCLRRSLSLNLSLSEAADYLTMLLVEQRRYQEAEQVMRDVEKRIPDPSPVLGRMAWLRRRRGEKKEAVYEMIALVHQSPWYGWGWGVLLDWLMEDEAWDEAKRVLAEVAPEQRTNTHLRQKRLEVLAKAGVKPDVLDQEWDVLLRDFPEELPLHLIRYDALEESGREQQAAQVIRHIRAIHPDSPYVLARWVEVLAREQNKEEAIANLLRLFFAETEPSVWPPDYAWAAIKKAHYEDEAWQRALAQLRAGKSPTVRAIAILAGYAMERNGVKEPVPQRWYHATDEGAQEILGLLKLVDALPGNHGAHRAMLLRKLSDFNHERLAVRYWKKNRATVEAERNSWSEAVRALTSLKRFRLARQAMAGWRERKGVPMWVVANYVMCLPGMGRRQLREVRSACHDALAGLPHDHCARYLAYREAEACALLNDHTGVYDCWKRYSEYFDGKLEKGEWFEEKRRYLMADVPGLARAVANNQPREYRALVWRMWRERLKMKLLPATPRAETNQKVKVPWWIIWIAIIALMRLLSWLGDSHQ